MKLYVELDIEGGTKSVTEALEQLSTAITARQASHDDALERRALEDYRDLSLVITDIDVR